MDTRASDNVPSTYHDPRRPLFSIDHPAEDTAVNIPPLGYLRIEGADRLGIPALLCPNYSNYSLVQSANHPRKHLELLEKLDVVDVLVYISPKTFLLDSQVLGSSILH